MPHRRHNLLLSNEIVLLNHVLCTLEVKRQLLLVLGRYILLIQQLVGFFDIIRVKHGVRIDLSFQIINRRRRYGSGEQRSRIVRCKCRFDIFVCICKVQHEGFLLERRANTIQAGKRLNSRYALQLFENIHSAEFRLVKPGLILIRNQKYLIFVLIKFFCQTILRETVHGSLGIFGFIVRELYFARKCNQSFDIGIAFFLCIILKRLTVFDRALPGSSDDHCLCHTAKFRHHCCAEMFNDNLYTLCNVRLVQFHKPRNLPLCISSLASRIFFNLLVQLIKGIISGIVLKHIKDKALLNGLFHRIDMKRLTLPFGVQSTKQLNRCGLGGGGESEHGNIRLFAISADFTRNHIFHIDAFLFSCTQRLCDRCHVLTCRGGMCLIDNNRKMLVFQPGNTVYNIREFLNCSGDDFRIAVQSNGKVCRVTLIVHDTDKPRFMLHAHNRFLQLTINHNSVSDDHDIVKDNFVVCIVQRSQAVRQPCDRVRFAGACAVLNQIVLRGTIVTDITQQLADHIKLMIPREYDILGLFRFSCQLVLTFLGFDKDELADEVENGIFCQNILPHIGHAVLVFESGIACTCIYSFAIAHIEWQEEGGVACEFSGHIDLFQIHSEVHKTTCLKPEQAGFRVTVNTVLIDGVLIGLTCGIAFQFKGHDGETIQENNQVNALIIACPDFLHDGENILFVFRQQLTVEGGCRLGVHKLQLHVGNLNAVLQHIQQTAARFGHLGIDKADEGILQVRLVDFTECLHLVRLGIVQELKQQLTIHSKQTVIAGCLTDEVTIVLREPVHDEMLIFFFRENIIHDLAPFLVMCSACHSHR